MSRELYATDKYYICISPMCSSFSAFVNFTMHKISISLHKDYFSVLSSHQQQQHHENIPMSCPELVG